MDELNLAEETRRPFGLSVVEIDKEEYHKLLAATTDGHLVEMYDWVVTGPEVPIINWAGGPCAIIYVRDNISGVTISGHMLNNSKDDLNFELKESAPYDKLSFEAIPTFTTHGGVVIPKDSEAMTQAIEATSYSYTAQALEKHRHYQAMLKRIQDLNKTHHDGKELTVYLFGQNYTFNEIDHPADSLLSTASNRTTLSADLSKAGILPHQIRDFRTDNLKTHVDHTILLPKSNTLYFTRGT